VRAASDPQEDDPAAAHVHCTPPRAPLSPLPQLEALPQLTTLAAKRVRRAVLLTATRLSSPHPEQRVVGQQWLPER
jgi:hypothetical protein